MRRAPQQLLPEERSSGEIHCMLSLVLEGISGIVEVGVGSFDGSTRIGLVPEVEAVGESMEVEGSFLMMCAPRVIHVAVGQTQHSLST